MLSMLLNKSRQRAKCRFAEKPYLSQNFSVQQENCEFFHCSVFTFLNVDNEIYGANIRLKIPPPHI